MNFESRRCHGDRAQSRPRSSSEGHRSQLVGQVAANIREWRKPEPYKGKGISIKASISSARKARRSKDADNGKQQKTLFLKRRLRVRNKLRKMNAGRLRLSVHRVNKNISVQLIDDVNGVTCCSIDARKGLGVVGKNNVEACNESWHGDCRTCESAGVEEATLIVAGSCFTAKCQGFGRRTPVKAGLEVLGDGDNGQENLTDGNRRPSRSRREEHRSSLIASLRSTASPKPLRVVSALALLRLSLSVTKKVASALARVKPKKCPRRSAKPQSTPSAR